MLVSLTGKVCKIDTMNFDYCGLCAYPAPRKKDCLWQDKVGPILWDFLNCN